MQVLSLSIIIPVYNVTDYLEPALESVQKQDMPEIETIVVDDGSDSLAAQVIEEICAKFERVTVIHQKNMGQAAARKAGVDKAQSDAVLFLDADDMLLPGAAKHLVAFLQQHPSAVACYGRKVNADEHGDVSAGVALPQTHEAVSGNVLSSLLKGKPLLSNGSVCIRKSALDKVEFPQHMHQGEDWVTWCYLALQGDILYAGDKTVLAIRDHEKRVSSQAFKNPTLLFSMLDRVFDEMVFIQAVDAKDLAFYRMVHTHTIHMHLWLHYKDSGQIPQALKHRFALLRMMPLPDENKIRVLHVTKHFYAGGAERLLTDILRHSGASEYEHIVLSLSDEEERLARVNHELGIPYHAIHMRRGKWNLFNTLRCFLFMRSIQADVIKTWLPPANVTGGIMGMLLRVPVIWGIHDAQSPKKKSRITRMQAPLSKMVPHYVVCCSDVVERQCLSAGYDEAKLVVIPNGVDSKRFAPQPDQGLAIRAQLGLKNDACVIGLAAECTPIKRHPYFLKAAKIMSEKHANVQFILCGKFADAGNKKLLKHIQTLGLESRVHLLGVRDDMPAIYSAMDINTLVSASESFGFSVAEAMACQTLNVASKVGVLPKLLDGVGEVIPLSNDPNMLVAAWEKTIALDEEEKQTRLDAGRKRIVEDYTIEQTAAAYDAMYAK